MGLDINALFGYPLNLQHPQRLPRKIVNRCCRFRFFTFLAFLAEGLVEEIRVQLPYADKNITVHMQSREYTLYHTYPLVV